MTRLEKMLMLLLLTTITLITSYNHNKENINTIEQISLNVEYGGKSKVNIEKIIEKKVKSTRYTNKLGAIRINKNEIVKPKEKVDNEITIDFFFDPVCPASAIYNKMLQKELKEDINKGRIEIKFRPVPYLNDKTIDDYSNRASSYILAVAEYAPTKTLDFINTVLNRDFQPETPAINATSDDKFIKAMSEIGMSEEEIVKVDTNKENFVSTAIASAEDFINENSEWLRFSKRLDEQGEPIMYSPFILVNKAGEMTNNALEINPEDPIEELKSAIKDINKGTN